MIFVINTALSETIKSKNILQLANIYGMLHVSARQLMLDIRHSDYSLMRNLQMPARIETEK
ncbi:MAG: hypothetical protein P8N03_00090 [Arenicellales bacterium]|nr:hypothetical protein [Arenicellales bacterium]